MPTHSATSLEVCDGVVLEDDGTVMKDGRPAAEPDVEVRTDLPRSHPLYGRRVVRVVPAGMPDCVVKDGRLVPVAIGSVEEPIEETIGEVIRGR